VCLYVKIEISTAHTCSEWTAVVKGSPSALDVACICIRSLHEELARRATLTFGIALRLNGHDLEAQGGFDAV
jgi:hypothetical protein